ncbi:MAG: PLP-dependent aspartate aminotransferase family protein [Candidatus Sumerlaeia bacterium]
MARVIRPETLRPETLAIHTGVYKDTAFNSVTTPIYPCSTFYFDKLGESKEYAYGRFGNPTRRALEENLAALEGGADSLATATGMAALSTAIFLMKSGDHIIAGNDIYGGTWRLLDICMPRYGIETSFVAMDDPAAIRAAIRPNTKAIMIETPSNPLLKLTDLALVSAIAKEHGLLTIIDNTFMTPLGQRPFDFGIDIVIHSTTKYINGHSDVIGGAIICKDKDLARQVQQMGICLGTVAAPFDAWLVLRGIKSFPQRMKAHWRGADAVARYLNRHPFIKRVFYPGLESHPQHELAKRQMRQFGGIVTFELDTAQIPISDFFSRLRFFKLAMSLGGVESLCEQPWSMSHDTMTEEARLAAGITPEIIRLSVGNENPEDLIDDLRYGLEGDEA